jgi:uncharacterized protein involved in outer membrane biogenesis
MRKPKPLTIVLIVLVLLVAAGAIAVRVVLGGDHIKAAIEAQASAALGRPVTIRTAAPRLFPRVSLDLDDIAIGETREITISRVRLSTGLRALIGRRVEDAQVSIEGSRIDVRWALALLRALTMPSSNPAPASTSPYALTIVSITSISLRDVTLSAGPHSLRVEMDSSMVGDDRFVVRRLHARSEPDAGVTPTKTEAAHSEFTASGEVDSLSKRTGKFAIDAAALDLDALMAFLAAATPSGGQARADASATPAPAPPAYNVEIDVRAKKGRALGIALANIAATCRVAGERVTLDGLQLDLFGGRFAGSAAYVGSAEPRYEWRGQFDNLDLPPLVAFAGASGSITGRLGGSLALTAAGEDPMAAIGRARGSARVALTDGRIPGLEIVRSVILAFGKPTGDQPGGSGESFTRIAATLAVSGPMLSTSDLTFASRDFDLTGDGRLSLATQAIDFRTDVILSRELSAQAGRDLYRLAREGDRILLPARITGTASSPTVFVDVRSAFQRAIRNRAQDELRNLFDRLRKK